MRHSLWISSLLLAIGLVLATPASAQYVIKSAPLSTVEVGQLPPAGVASFDPVKATDAYLATVPAKDRAKTNAYVEGGYVLQLVDVLYALAEAALLLWLGISAWIRNRAAAITSRKFFQAPLYVLIYIGMTALLSLPLTIYKEFFREHQYGLSNQTFGAWFGEFALSLLISTIAMAIALALIYAAARAVQRRWWVWASGITVAFVFIGIVLSPVFIAPLFNTYTPLPDSGMKNAILSQARANGVPAKDVFTYDESKQSKRVSANVSGLFGTMRISLNDNLLNRCTPSQVLAVVGHEMGHYVMNHPFQLATYFGLVFVFGFWFVDKTFHGLLRLFGKRWQVTGIDDPAGLPIIMAMLSLYMFLATPLTNTIVRVHEVQADLFALNAVRQPDAQARALLTLAEYRKLDPTPLEEFVFFDHPSGRNRVLMAMRWKAEHLNDPDIMAGPISPQ